MADHRLSWGISMNSRMMVWSGWIGGRWTFVQREVNLNFAGEDFHLLFVQPSGSLFRRKSHHRKISRRARIGPRDFAQEFMAR